MFSVSRQTDYAVRIVLHLACQESGVRVSIPDIARVRLLPVPFVRRIVSRLAEVGILATLRGVNGGVALARAAQDVTLQDVVEAMEGPACPSPCHAEPRSCPMSLSCPVRDIWTSTSMVLENHLRTIRFSDLANDSAHSQAHRAPVVAAP